MKQESFTYWRLFAIVLLLPFFACEKYLDKKSDKTLVVPRSLSDFQGMMDDFEIMNREATPSTGESSADDYFILDDVYNAAEEFERSFYTWQTYDKPLNEDWATAYRAIYYTNIVLEGMKNIQMTPQNDSLWKEVKGSALFYRAYHFLQLAWIFAKAYDPVTAKTDLGIALRMQSDFNIPSVRSTVDETYGRIIQDASASIDLLPPLPLHPLRPSRAAAYGLLARTFLSMNQYDSAHKYSNLSLSIKKNILDYNQIDLNQMVTFEPYNEEIIFHTATNNFIGLHDPYSASVDTILYSKYADNDLRKKAFFDDNGFGYKLFKGSYHGEYNRRFSGITVAEMYLVRAECLARSNRLNDAIADLNTLLVNRYESGSYVEPGLTDRDDLVLYILEERRKELVMRGLRWPDIKRLNKMGYAITLKRTVEGKEFLLPPNSDYYALALPWELVENYHLPQN